MSERLWRLIEGFKTINPSYGFHDSAKGCCAEASYAFHNLLMEEGFRSHTWDIVLDDDHDRHYCPEWYPNIIFEGHCVNYVEGVVIDWTARQYCTLAPFPLIYRPPKKARRTGIDDLHPALTGYIKY
jgi:hypothetical protein